MGGMLTPWHAPCSVTNLEIASGGLHHSETRLALTSRSWRSAVAIERIVFLTLQETMILWGTGYAGGHLFR